MNKSDYKKFSETFGAAWDFHKPLSERAIAVAFRQLSAYPLAIILGAIDAHMTDSQRGQFPPKPADLIAQIERHVPQQQRLGADEAWALMPTSEDQSIVWSTEMAEAWAVASPLLDDGDRIGARMAFKGAYERLCEQNRAQGRPVVWELSRGWSGRDVQDVVSEAVRLGRLSQDQAVRYLTAVEYQQPVSVVGLLANAKTPQAKGAALEFVASLKKMLNPESIPVDWDKVHGELEEMERRMDAKTAGKALESPQGAQNSETDMDEWI